MTDKRHPVGCRGVLTGLFGAACLALVGCGSGTGDLTGTVTYQGKALRTGSVLVGCEDGRVLTGTIQDDGTYSVSGIPAGSVKVAVTSPDPTKQKVAQRKKGDAKPVADGSKWFAIPAKYAEFAESGLQVTVAAGANAVNLELK